MRIFLFLLTLCCSGLAISADEKQKKPEPLDPKYEGIHGMVLFNNGYKIYASHLPTYFLPHNAQVVYRLEIESNALIHLVRDADLVTIKPERFNLQRLIRGEKVTVDADVYMGHFERGGSLTFAKTKIVFGKQLYVRQFDDLLSSSNHQNYDIIDLVGDERILIHRIQKAPSYDHLVLLYEKVSCLTDFKASSAVPAEGELINRLSFCGAMKPIYYETQDFVTGPKY